MSPSCTARRLAGGAVLALLAAVAVLAWGAWELSSPAMSVADTCRLLHHQPFDPAYGTPHLLPLSRRCNATYDLVPAYVNPAALTLTATAAALTALALHTTHRTRRTRRPTGR